MVGTILSQVRIVLVEPAGSFNVGAIARVMKNMGLQHLVLVNPQCDPVGLAARQMAMHALDLLEAAQQVTTIPAALQGCQRVIATTARPRATAKLEHPRTGLPWLLQATVHSALIFGPEDRGLSNGELNYAQRFVCIPSSPTYPSLNLAQAVAVCCYELNQSAHQSSTQNSLEWEARPDFSQQLGQLQSLPNSQGSSSATLEVLEGYYQQLEAVLLKIGYLYPHTAASRMEKFRQLFNRAQLSSTEVAMLRGILTQVGWALEVKSKD